MKKVIIVDNKVDELGPIEWLPKNSDRYIRKIYKQFRSFLWKFEKFIVGG